LVLQSEVPLPHELISLLMCKSECHPNHFKQSIFECHDESQLHLHCVDQLDQLLAHREPKSDPSMYKSLHDSGGPATAPPHPSLVRFCANVAAGDGWRRFPNGLHGFSNPALPRFAQPLSTGSHISVTFGKWLSQ